VERKKEMKKKITSKPLVPVVGALGVALIMGTGMGGCGHHVSVPASMSPSSTQSEVVHTVDR
jgi:hypothetical protein